MTICSIIIPTRNRQHFLDEAIESVLAQSLHELELLVVNDGDTSVATPRDKRITVLDNNNRGAVAARNLGIEQARGAIVAFLDDDDVWIDRNHLRNASNALESTAAFYFADGHMRFPKDLEPRIFAKDATATTLERDNTILISSVCYRRSLHAELGTFDEKLPYYWDWDWYLRVARAGHVMFRQRTAAVDIRVHAANMSSDTNSPQRAENLLLLAAKHGLPPLKLKNHSSFVS